MEGDEDTDARLHSLRKRSGKVWSAMDGVVSGDMLKECRLTLFGRLFSNPTANSQAFVDTMKRAWRIEDVVSADLGSGLFAFTFKSEGDRDRVVESGPWSFANHLLLLKPWEPNTPPHRYEFAAYAFWVQIRGLPFEWYSVDVVNIVAQGIGKVLDAKVKRKGFLSPAAKVEMNLGAPLKSSTLASGGGTKLWLDVVSWVIMPSIAQRSLMKKAMLFQKMTFILGNGYEQRLMNLALPGRPLMRRISNKIYSSRFPGQQHPNCGFCGRNFWP